MRHVTNVKHMIRMAWTGGSTRVSDRVTRLAAKDVAAIERLYADGESTGESPDFFYAVNGDRWRVLRRLQRRGVDRGRRHAPGLARGRRGGDWQCLCEKGSPRTRTRTSGRPLRCSTSWPASKRSGSTSAPITMRPSACMNRWASCVTATSARGSRPRHRG